jgi:heterodisulfide reductase subunit B
MKEYTYYPGCSGEASGRPSNVSARNVAHALGLDLIELPDWNCCGATTYLSVNGERAVALSARNLALAEDEHRDLVAICSGCFSALNKANRRMADSGELKGKIDRALHAAGLEYHGTTRVRHLLDVFVNDVGEGAIRDKVEKPLKGLRVAAYCGCLLGRPKGMFDDPEFPTSLDRVLSWLGAEPVWYPVKAKCCGGMLMTSQPEVCERLVERLLSLAVEAGAECVATICPLCQINLEGYQKRINKAFGTRLDLPVFYFTQLMGLAMGMGEQELLLRENLTPSEALAARF